MPHLFPLQLLLVTFAGWSNRHQAQAIDYLIEENRVLKEQLGKKRLRLSDDQRRRLAAKGHALGRQLLNKVATIVTPDTIMRWHRRLIALKWTYHTGRVGRLGIMKEIRKLIVRMATENSGWGYTRIVGELKKLDRTVARTTVAKTLKDHGIPPSTDRPTTWRAFLKAHANVICAADFFTTEVWTARGLVTHYVLFVIDHASRAVHIAGITTNPNRVFMTQMALELTDPIYGFLRNKRYLILDNDILFKDRFSSMLEDEGVKVVHTGYQAPDMNAFAERWVRSIKTECLSNLILVGNQSLEDAVSSFAQHYNRERPHQGIGNELVATTEITATGPVMVTERLGGVLKHYYRSVA